MRMRAHVVSKDYTDLQELWLLEERSEFDLLNINLGEDGVFTLTKIDEHASNSDLKPFLSMRGPMARAAFPAIIEALSKNGFERPSESTLRGRCEAMDAHLQDLRTLMKLRG